MMSSSPAASTKSDPFGPAEDPCATKGYRK